MSSRLCSAPGLRLGRLTSNVRFHLRFLPGFCALGVLPMNSFHGWLSFGGFAAEKGLSCGVSMGAWFARAHQASAVHVLRRGHPGGNAQRRGHGLSTGSKIESAKAHHCLISGDPKSGLNLTRRSTRTQPLPSAKLFRVCDSSSLFVVRSAAGPVNFHR